MALDLWQLELPDRDVLLGSPSTNTTLLRDPPPRMFFGLPTPRTHDIERHITHGDAAGLDVFTSRLLSFSIDVEGAGNSDAAMQASARERSRFFVAGWRPGRGDVALDVALPGQPEDVLRYFGRPRNLDEGDWLYTFGRLRFLAAFSATDPYAYGAEQTLLTQSGTFDLPGVDCGDLEADSRRLVLTIHGNGGTPTIVNTTQGGSITFVDAALAMGQTYVVDVAAMTVTRGGIDRTVDVSPASPWLALAGGVTNTFTLTGAADVDVTWRPAYL